MLNTIRRFAKRYAMLTPGSTVVTGISGGADSVCLLLVLKELQKDMDFSIVAVHVNHGIRGEEAKRDEYFVVELCKKYGIELKVFHEDVVKSAMENKISVEEAGRMTRYRIFEQTADRIPSCENTKIAVAHHMEDQTETVLMNMIRGCGLKGAGGIQPVRGRIIRPMMCVRRYEIEEYLKSIGQDYVTDSSNLGSDYTRNKFRNIILPYLEKEINPHVVENICRMAGMLTEADTYIMHQAENALTKCIRVTNTDIYRIYIAELLKYDRIIKRYMIQIILFKISKNRKDIYAVHIESIIELEHREVGSRIDLPYGITAVRRYDWIEIGKKKADGDLIAGGGAGSLEAIWVTGLQEYLLPPGFYQKGRDTAEFKRIKFLKIPAVKKITGSDYTKLVDYDKIKFTICIRTRRTGDYIVINSRGGKKKVKDYFIDQKIPKEERDQVLLIADGSQIIWIVGYRLSEAYKITRETKNILKISIE